MECSSPELHAGPDLAQEEWGIAVVLQVLEDIKHTDMRLVICNISRKNRTL